MRTFNFRARNIGEEKYLSYTMGEDCELDEDVLDYCQDNAPEELIEIIYDLPDYGQDISGGVHCAGA